MIHVLVLPSRDQDVDGRVKPGHDDENWMASQSLSSGAHSRDPLARNDGERLSENLTPSLRGAVAPRQSRSHKENPFHRRLQGNASRGNSDSPQSSSAATLSKNE